MADNSTLPVNSGTEVFANDDVGGVKYPRAKMVWGPDGTVNDTDVATGKPMPIQMRSPTGTAWDLAPGTGGSNTPRVAIDTSQVPVLGPATKANSLSVSIADMSNGEYETVAASQTAQALGATGGTGDYIAGLLVIPATTSPGLVTLLDNAISIPVFVGGATSVSNLIPFYVPLGIYSVSGAWKITTGANVSVIGIGNFA